MASFSALFLMLLLVPLPSAAVVGEPWICYQKDGTITMQDHAGPGCERQKDQEQRVKQNENQARQQRRKGPLRVLSLRCDREREFAYARGEIENVSNQTYRLPKIVVVWRDQAGHLVVSDWTFPALAPLGPGERSPFESMVRRREEMVSCSVTVQPEAF